MYIDWNTMWVRRGVRLGYLFTPLDGVKVSCLILYILYANTFKFCMSYAYPRPLLLRVQLNRQVPVKWVTEGAFG